MHFVIDDAHAAELAEQWRQLGLQRVPLELVACSDRRLTRAAVECVARELSDRQTEVSVLLPERKYKGIWHRILHDRTGDAIQEQVSHLAHANVTVGPVPLRARVRGAGAAAARRPDAAAAAAAGADPAERRTVAGGERVLPGAVPIVEATWRRRVTVGGRVRSVRVAPLHDSPTPRGGARRRHRRHLPRLPRTTGRRRDRASGTPMTAEGMVGVHQARLAIINPVYRLVD